MRKLILSEYIQPCKDKAQRQKGTKIEVKTKTRHKDKSKNSAPLRLCASAPCFFNEPSRHCMTGFTIIEVMVALAVVGASLGVFISIMGNSLRMRWRLEDHAKDVVTARVTAERLGLGLMKDDLEGKTEDGSQLEIVPIEITGRKKANEFGSEIGNAEDAEGFAYDDTVSKKIDFYNVVVDGVEVSSSVKGIKK